jgi:hypothetical protein
MLMGRTAPIVASVRKAVLWDFYRALVREHLPTVGTVANVWTVAVLMPCTFIGKRNSLLFCSNFLEFTFTVLKAQLRIFPQLPKEGSVTIR